MPEIVIRLNNLNEIKDFVNLSNMCSGEVNVYNSKYIGNGKSLKDVMNLNITDIIKVEIEGDIPLEVKENMKKYIV